jgi:hypothetical protein
MQSTDRGTPYIPVALILDHYAGYNGYMGLPWGILPISGANSNYQQICDLFDYQLFPGSDFIHHSPPDPSNPESGYLVQTPYAEMYNVHLTNASQDVLASYQTLLLVGDITFDSDFLTSLEYALRQGSVLLMSQFQADALGPTGVAALQAAGTVEVLDPWVNPATGRSAAISDDRLQLLVNNSLPVAVSVSGTPSYPVQYQVNYASDGWIVELINNNGVVKQPSTAAVTDPTAIANVQITPTFSYTSATALFAGTNYGSGSSGTPIQVTVGPGDVEYVKFVTD